MLVMHIQRLGGLLLAVVMTACGGGDEIVGSCQQPQMSDGSRICIDANADTSDLVRGTCRIGRGNWVEGQSCDRSGAIGGCETGNGAVMWSYPSEKMTSIDDLLEVCDGRVIALDPGD